MWKILNPFLRTPNPPPPKQCLFLTRLPPELRIQIYKLVFGHGLIHLLHQYNIISYIRTNPSEFGNEYKIPTSLLLTCRQIHSEAAPILYSTNTFRVSLQRTWIIFANAIGAHNLSFIRCLRAPIPQSITHWTSSMRFKMAGDDNDTYAAFCEILATKMPGLVELELVLLSLPVGEARAVDAGWHAPIRRIRGLRRFRVEIQNRLVAGEEDTVGLVGFLTETVCGEREGGEE
ncbi:hypothetical protein FQN50_009145 [Emmonsiellopsis sp. PD_5]|nr:hypothetical protein FQN50_009145 [Emmonsiellopsis sp. PD_5]